MTALLIMNAPVLRGPSHDHGKGPCRAETDRIKLSRNALISPMLKACQQADLLLPLGHGMYCALVLPAKRSIVPESGPRCTVHLPRKRDSKRSSQSDLADTMK